MRHPYREQFIALLLVYLVFFILIVLLTFYNVINSTNATTLGLVITAVATVMAAFIANTYNEESKRRWNKNDSLWDKTLISTTTAVKELKEMQFIIRGMVEIHNAYYSDPTLVPLKITNKVATAYGGWLIAEHPEFFKVGDKGFSELPEKISKLDTNIQSPTTNDVKETKTILSNILVLMNSEFLRSYARITEPRTTLGVIAIKRVDLFKHITRLINKMDLDRRDIMNSSDQINGESLKISMDSTIKFIQDLCWRELEITRMGSRDDAIGAIIEEENEKKIQQMIEKNRSKIKQQK
jgi:hypothetical protein